MTSFLSKSMKQGGGGTGDNIYQKTVRCGQRTARRAAADVCACAPDDALPHPAGD